jgi:hypothetical protein
LKDMPAEAKLSADAVSILVSMGRKGKG